MVGAVLALAAMLGWLPGGARVSDEVQITKRGSLETPVGTR